MATRIANTVVRTVAVCAFGAGCLLVHQNESKADTLRDRFNRVSHITIDLEMRQLPMYGAIIERIGEGERATLPARVNRAVNTLIEAVSDERQYGVQDYWASPAETLKSGMGDCEDYALLKRAILRAYGIESEVLIVNRGRHAVLRVGDRVLDNRDQMLRSVNAYQIEERFGNEYEQARLRENGSRDPSNPAD